MSNETKQGDEIPPEDKEVYDRLMERMAPSKRNQNKPRPTSFPQLATLPTPKIEGLADAIDYSSLVPSINTEKKEGGPVNTPPRSGPPSQPSPPTPPVPPSDERDDSGKKKSWVWVVCVVSMLIGFLVVSICLQIWKKDNTSKLAALKVQPDTPKRLVANKAPQHVAQTQPVMQSIQPNAEVVIQAPSTNVEQLVSPLPTPTPTVPTRGSFECHYNTCIEVSGRYDFWLLSKHGRFMEFVTPPGTAFAVRMTGQPEICASEKSFGEMVIREKGFGNILVNVNDQNCREWLESYRAMELEIIATDEPILLKYR